MLTFGKGIGGGRFTSLANTSASMLHFPSIVFRTSVIISLSIFLSLLHVFASSSIFSFLSNQVKNPFSVMLAIFGS